MISDTRIPEISDLAKHEILDIILGQGARRLPDQKSWIIEQGGDTYVVTLTDTVLGDGSDATVTETVWQSRKVT